MNVTGKTNTERVAVLSKRHRRGVTLTYRLHDGSIVTRSGIVQRVDVTAAEENWAVEISQPPIPGLSNRVSARIHIDQLIEIVVGTSRDRIYI